MKVGNTAFHFAGHEKVAQEQKTVKSAIPELTEQPISVSISKEGYENYRNSVQESDSQSEGIRTASDIIREHSPETDEKIGGLVSDFWNTRDESYLMQASRVIRDWFNENYSKYPEWFDSEESSKIDTNTEKSGALPDGRKGFVEIMQENTPDIAKKMQEFIHNFWNTRDQGFMEKASRLAADWFNENYSKHPEWFNEE